VPNSRSLNLNIKVSMQIPPVARLKTAVSLRAGGPDQGDEIDELHFDPFSDRAVFAPETG
jgi:hypothetical protein